MKYTSRDLIRAYRERSVHGSMTKNAQAMGITVPSLCSLFDSLDKPTPKGLKAITRKAWHKLHDKMIIKASAQVGQLSVEQHLEKIAVARSGWAPEKTLERIVQDFEDDVADFISRAVEVETKDIINRSQKELMDKNLQIKELNEKLINLQIIAEVAKKENRLVALTKKFFHED